MPAGGPREASRRARRTRFRPRAKPSPTPTDAGTRAVQAWNARGADFGRPSASSPPKPAPRGALAVRALVAGEARARACISLRRQDHAAGRRGGHVLHPGARGGGGDSAQRIRERRARTSWRGAGSSRRRRTKNKQKSRPGEGPRAHGRDAFYAESKDGDGKNTRASTRRSGCVRTAGAHSAKLAP